MNLLTGTQLLEQWTEHRAAYGKERATEIGTFLSAFGFSIPLIFSPFVLARFLLAVGIVAVVGVTGVWADSFWKHEAVSPRQAICAFLFTNVSGLIVWATTCVWGLFVLVAYYGMANWIVWSGVALMIVAGMVLYSVTINRAQSIQPNTDGDPAMSSINRWLYRAILLPLIAFGMAFLTGINPYGAILSASMILLGGMMLSLGLIYLHQMILIWQEPEQPIY